MLELCNDAVAKKICQIIENSGGEAYLVGGIIRDAFSNKQPSDYDFAVNTVPEKTTEIFERAGCKVYKTGTKHGTVTVKCDGLPKVELTTYREESQYVNGRRPEHVEFITSIKSDLSRRDITIGAMALRPTTKNHKCEIVDPFGGQEDLKNGIIRAVGNPLDRFSEDGLRVFRVARFAAKYGFEVEPETLKALSNTKVHTTIKMVSQERISEEFKKALETKRPSKFITLLAESGLLWLIIPEMKSMIGMLQPKQHHDYDVWEHSLSAMKSIIPCKYKKEIEEFLHSPVKNQWLEFDDIEIYVRKSKRLLDGKYVNALDMASANVPEHLWGRGIYSLVSNSIEQVARENNLYVYKENVLDKNLRESLKRDDNYKQVKELDPPCYYKKPEDVKKNVCVIPNELAFMRWMALVHDIGKPESYNMNLDEPHFIGHDKTGSITIEKIMRRMKGWNANEIIVAKNLVLNHLVFYNPEWSDAQLRRWVNRVGPENVQMQINLAKADLIGHGSKKVEELKYYTHLEQRLTSTKEKGFTVKDLKVTGNDVMDTLNIGKGPRVGEVLSALVEKVIENPSLNEKEKLIELIRTMRETQI